jgi:membrane protein YqaA with SNARE-associated domain
MPRAMAALGVYLGLFFTAFAAATIFPAQSEALLGGLLLSNAYSPVLLIAVATLGNTLGSCVNWWLGRSVERFKGRAWFPVSGATLIRYQARYQRWGKWSLLLSWAPFGGDALTVIAGVMREPFMTFLAIVSFAKLARYLVLAALVLQFV